MDETPTGAPLASPSPSAPAPAEKSICWLLEEHGVPSSQFDPFCRLHGVRLNDTMPADEFEAALGAFLHGRL